MIKTGHEGLAHNDDFGRLSAWYAEGKIGSLEKWLKRAGGDVDGNGVPDVCDIADGKGAVKR